MLGQPSVYLIFQPPHGAWPQGDLLWEAPLLYARVDGPVMDRHGARLMAPWALGTLGKRGPGQYFARLRV